MNNTAKQLVEQLGNSTEITIMADVVHGLDFEYEQLQQENENLKQINEEHRKLNGELREENKKLKNKLFSPDVVDSICPKCGERYSTNYSRVVYDLQQENKELKERLDIEIQNHIMSDKNYCEIICNYKNILTEFEKWIEEQINNIYGIDNKYGEFDTIIETYQDCLDKLQELKEVKNDN